MLSGLKKGLISPREIISLPSPKGVTSGLKTGVCSSGDLVLNANRLVRDPDRDKVALLLHMDGVNGSNNFSEVTGKVVVANGGAIISTAQSKFGGASASFNGTSSYLEIPYSTDLVLSNIEFTFETWVYFNSVAGTQIISGLYDNSANNRRSYALLIDLNSFGFYWSTDGTFQLVNTINGGTPLVSQWYYLAATRSGNTITLYVNGVSVGSKTFAGSFFSSPLTNFRVGSGYGNSFVNGFVDDTRLSRINRSIATPASAFPDI